MNLSSLLLQLLNLVTIRTSYGGTPFNYKEVLSILVPKTYISQDQWMTRIYE